MPECFRCGEKLQDGGYITASVVFLLGPRPSGPANLTPARVEGLDVSFTIDEVRFFCIACGRPR